MSQRFSERIGISKSIQSIQVESMSEELRNSLWNLCVGEIDANWRPTALLVAEYFLKTPVDNVPHSTNYCRDWVREQFYGLDWAQCYDLFEFIAEHINLIRHPDGYSPRDMSDAVEPFQNIANIILERELSGFRFVSGILSPISGKIEIESIEIAIELSNSKGLSGSSVHLRTAIELLGKKPTPDYRNSIKESISAVESLVNQITNSSSAGVSDALDLLGKTTELHGALKAAFKQLYGYTSDENGIRHAILDQPTVGFDEAKFMLVACSAFVNFVIAKAEKAMLLGKSRN